MLLPSSLTTIFSTLKFLISSSSEKSQIIEISTESPIAATIEGAETMLSNNTVNKVENVFVNISFFCLVTNIIFNSNEYVNILKKYFNYTNFYVPITAIIYSKMRKFIVQYQFLSPIGFDYILIIRKH